MYLYLLTYLTLDSLVPITRGWKILSAKPSKGLTTGLSLVNLKHMSGRVVVLLCNLVCHVTLFLIRNFCVIGYSFLQTCSLLFPFWRRFILLPIKNLNFLFLHLTDQNVSISRDLNKWRNTKIILKFCPLPSHIQISIYIDGCCAVVRINFSLVTPVNRQRQSEGY